MCCVHNVTRDLLSPGVYTVKSSTFVRCTDQHVTGCVQIQYSTDSVPCTQAGEVRCAPHRTLHRICSRDNTQSNCAEHFKPHKNLASTLTNHTSCTRFSPVASQYRCTITNKHCAALKLSVARSGAQLTMHTARINVSDTQTRLQYRGAVQETADARRDARSARVATTSIHQPHAASL